MVFLLLIIILISDNLAYAKTLAIFIASYSEKVIDYEEKIE